MKTNRTRFDLFPGAMLPLLLGLVLLLPLPVAAQSSNEGAPSAVEIPENLTHADVRDLVARLFDDQVRTLIIQQLDKLASAEADDSGANAYVEQFGAGLAQARLSLERSFETTAWTTRR